MTGPSLSSSPSFLLRAQQSEQRRALIMAGLFGIVALMFLSRRLLGGTVMGHDGIFYFEFALYMCGVAYEVFVAFRLASANRRACLIASAWRWYVSAGIDLGVPFAGFCILVWFSPRGPVAALSAPALLVFPLVVFISTMRLRPRFTLATGLAAAVGHGALVGRVLVVSEVDPDLVPVLLAYPVLLLVIAVAAWILARDMRLAVVAGADEAAAHERDLARLAGIERDLSVARDIQTGLLPVGSPGFAGFDIAGMNVPADETGGDYYDWQELPDGRLAVVLADVTGHGIGPAIVMAVCRAYSRASAPVAPDASALLSRLNRLLHGDLQGTRFITLAIVLLSSEGRAELLSAGHGPTMLYRAATGVVEQFGGDGLPLGVDPDADYPPTRSLELARGDVLVLFTDGFFEWRRPSDREAFGVARLEGEVRRHARDDAATILKNIDASVRAFTAGAAQSDDMTAVVIKRL